MGRASGKLIPFLKYHLEMNSFINLRYEDSEVFYIELPRYDKEKIGKYEIILKAWYEVNGKLHKYINYSNGKSVIQAGLKNSIYLVTLPSIGKRLRFRWATALEIIENRRLQKEKSRSDQQPPASPSYPPSVSSGYHSGSEESEVESKQVTEMEVEEEKEGLIDVMNEVLENPEKYIQGCNFDDDFFSDIKTDNDDNLPFQDILLEEALKPPYESEQLSSPVTELKPTLVSAPVFVKKYWLCTQKIKIKSTLQLICESKIIENENSDVKEGSVVIPNGVFEPGISYDLKKSVELDEMLLFLFFSPNLVL